MRRIERILQRQSNWRRHVRDVASPVSASSFPSDCAQVRPLSTTKGYLSSSPSRCMLNYDIRKSSGYARSIVSQKYCFPQRFALDHSNDPVVQNSRLFSTSRSREIPEYISRINEHLDDNKNSEETKADAEEFKKLKLRTKRLEREGIFSSDPWRETQLTVVRALFDSWMAVEPTTSAQHREKAGWCTRIVKRWVYHVASHTEKGSFNSQGDYHLDGLRHYWIRALKLWKFPGSTLKDAVQATQLLMSFFNNVLPLFSSQGSCDPSTAETLDKAYSIVFALLAQNWKNPVVVQYADRLWEDRLILDETLGSTPNIFLWTSYLTVLARCSPLVPQGLERVEEVWSDMMDSGVEPNTRALSVLLFAWSHSDRPDAGERVQALLEQYDPSIEDSYCVRLAIETWGNCDLPEKGEELLWKYIYQQQQRVPSQSTQTRDSEAARVESQPFYFAIDAWGDSDHPDAAERAENIIVKMQNLYDAGQTDLKPRSEHYKALMNVWSNKSGSGQDVEQLLRRIQQALGDQLYEDGLDVYAELYSIAIQAWRNTDKDEAPARAQKLLNEIRTIAKRRGDTSFLKTPLYMRAIQAWAAQKQLKEGPDCAFAILRQMQDEDGIRADAIVYNAVINVYAQQGLAEQAEYILDEMKNEASMGSASAGPNVASYASVIHAYTNSGYATLGENRCRELVAEMESTFDKQAGNGLLLLNDVVYSFLIRLIGKRSAEDASAIMQHMTERHQANPACPDVSTHVCNTLLQCWASSRDGVAPQRADALLSWMKEQSLEHGNAGVTPDFKSYRYVMRTWVSSRRKSSVEHLERLLLDMISMGMVSENDANVVEFQSSLHDASDTNEMYRAVEAFFRRFQ